MKTFTAHDVSLAAARNHDMDYHAAADAVETYITQIEGIDGRAIDRESIPEEDVDFVLESIRRAQDDTTVAPLDLVAEAAEKVAKAEDALAVAREERNRAIIAAVDAGAPIRQISIAGHIARQSIYAIIDKR